jgi:hypothetical protein
LIFSNQWYRIYCSCQGGSRSTGAKVSARIFWDLFRVPVLAFVAIMYSTYYHGVCPVCKPWHEAQIVVRVTAHDPCRNRPSPDETTQRPPKCSDLNGQTSNSYVFCYQFFCHQAIVRCPEVSLWPPPERLVLTSLLAAVSLGPAPNHFRPVKVPT